jgi:hypothetical protein
MISYPLPRAESPTSDHVNEAIRHETEENVARYAAQGREAIERRLDALDRGMWSARWKPMLPSLRSWD